MILALPFGGMDVMGGQLAEKLPGMSGGADGYTVLLTTDATFSINPHLYAKLPFDTQRGA